MSIIFESPTIFQVTLVRAKIALGKSKQAREIHLKLLQWGTGAKVSLNSTPLKQSTGIFSFNPTIHIRILLKVLARLKIRNCECEKSGKTIL
jgi:hypothetical protein